jgi:peptidoglycan hydrolase CwlO-like protein
MARVLLILSIVLTLVTAGIGFMAKQKVDALQGDLLSSKRDLNATRTTLTKTRTELDGTKKDLADTKQQLDDRSADLAKAKTELDNAQRDLAKANADVEAKTKQMADIQAQLAAIKGSIGEVSPEQLGTKIKELSDMNTRLSTELAEAKQVQETLNERVRMQEEQVATKQREVDAYRNVTVRQGLSGRILAYNPGWNFVVLSVGDKAGLKAGVQMIVARGNQMIGKVRVTSVEPNTAIADVLPGTVARGQSIQAGDTVIYEGSR